MKKKNIILITGLMAFALLGVMAMQFYFLRQSYLLQSSVFDSSVKQALNNVVLKISTQDANRFLINKANGQYNNGQNVTDQPDVSQKKITLKYSQTGGIKHQLKFNLENYKNDHNQLRAQKIASLRDSIKRLRKSRELAEISGSLDLRLKFEQYTDEYGNISQNITPQITTKTLDPRAYRRKNGKLNKYIDTLRSTYIDPLYGPQVVSIPRLNPLWVQEQERKKNEQQIRQVQKMLQNETADTPVKTQESEKHGTIEILASQYQHAGEPLKERINPILLDTLLRLELHNQGIDLPFSYDVYMMHNDSLIFSKAMDTKGEKPVFLTSEVYQMPIFNNEVINDPGNLKLSFPQKNLLILSHMAATMSTSGGLLLVLISCFGYTIYSILKQKKLAEMRTDFINNMTHEFKTPVSTIMIASEALQDEEIVADTQRVAKLANIIYEENVRLGSHIERVLNIARIEKNDFKLEVKPVDVNELITTVLDSMLLKLQKHGAVINLNLSEDALMIQADELHFSNVIYNLVDNAIKYSRYAPDITITSGVKGNQAVIKIADKGIGMSHDQQSKIFEQFYRVPTGNLHDVKGFGLGLSYVNTIVKRLNGTISVKSEKEKGSEFELRFNKI